MYCSAQHSWLTHKMSVVRRPECAGRGEPKATTNLHRSTAGGQRRPWYSSGPHHRSPPCFGVALCPKRTILSSGSRHKETCTAPLDEAFVLLKGECVAQWLSVLIAGSLCWLWTAISFSSSTGHTAQCTGSAPEAHAQTKDWEQNSSETRTDLTVKAWY